MAVAWNETVRGASRNELSKNRKSSFFLGRARGVFIRRNGTVEWNDGMERWNGTMEWNGGMEWNGCRECACADCIIVQFSLVFWSIQDWS